MIQTRLKGMGVALITPFKEDGSVDYEALLRLVDYQLKNGTDFLCVLGTTAETPTLTKEEKEKVKRTIIDRVNGRIPILLGVGSNSTQAVVDSVKNDDMTGVAAEVLCVPKLSIGTEIYYTKYYLEIPHLFAWTVVVVTLSLILEKLLTWSLNRWSRRWPV